ncbi:hypothetical protein [Streptosporangium sp. NPDC002524]|uniref:hypothetical protein n=1 Tax=Streptosporangium sp. NPDC002524 TaxID=3154537 RepID=UPI00331CD374
MFTLTLTPAPTPTVTVTETVVVPTALPTPMITIAPPLEGGLDFWKDVFFGDFFGALIGAGAAIGVAYWLIKREREARLEERRHDRIEALMAALTRLFKSLVREDEEEAKVAYETVLDHMFITSMIGRLEDPHSAFKRWLEKHQSLLMKAWRKRKEDGGYEGAADVTQSLISGIAVWAERPKLWEFDAPDEETIDQLFESTLATPSPRPSE